MFEHTLYSRHSHQCAIAEFSEQRSGIRPARASGWWCTTARGSSDTARRAAGRRAWRSAWRPEEETPAAGGRPPGRNLDPWGELRRTLARHRHRRRMLAVALSTSYVPTPRTASLRAAVRLPSQSAGRCCALPEDDIEAARRALERTLLLDSTSTPEEQPEPEAPKSSSDALDFTEPSTDTSRSGPFRFAEPEPRPGPVIDDIDAGLAEVQDFGERVGGLAWLGATFWLQLPGIQYFVLGAFLLFGALVAGGSFGGAPNRFLASAPQAYEGAYYSYRYASPGVTDESAYVMDDPVQ